VVAWFGIFHGRGASADAANLPACFSDGTAAEPEMMKEEG
jgi:hypothetical protein